MRNQTKSAAVALAFGAVAVMAEPVLAARRYRTKPRDSVIWSPGPGENVILKNVEIVDVKNGVILHKRGLLIRDGKIVEILTEKKAGSQEAGRVIDVRGMHAIPGLINAHCHMTLPSVLAFNAEIAATFPRQIERNFEECITHGITTVRDAGSMQLHIRRYIDRVEAGELLGPRVYHAGAAIVKPGGYPSNYIPSLPALLTKKFGHIVRQVETPQEARDAVKRNLEEGSDFIKLAFDDQSFFIGQKSIPILDDEQLSAVVEEAHNQGVKVTAHHSFRRSFIRGIDFGLDGLEHLPGDEILDDSEVEAFVAGGHYVVPTAQAGWALCGVSKNDPYLDYPLIQRILANRLEIVKTLYPALCEPTIFKALMKYESNYRNPSYVERRHLSFTLDPKFFNRAVVNGNENLNKLYHAGALIGCGNDGGIPQVVPGILGIEMMLLEEITDMKPLDILRAATINNARIIGVEEKLGSLEKGKLADLVLLSGNPLEHLEHMLHPQAVFKEGNLVYSIHNIQTIT
jgi:imidazolonepropionase-like amidohydrolase